MQRKVIKRFGTNNKGADPNWIVDTRLIPKYDPTPDGYESITNFEWKNQLKEQKTLFKTWKDSQPRAPRDLNQLQNKLANRVNNKPSQAYRLYKYLSSELVNTVVDITLPPKGIDYTISLLPKLKAVRTINKGFLTEVIWYGIYNNVEEEVLKVSIEYTLANDAPMNSAKTVLSRVTKRQWIKEDGTYQVDELDVKITNKEYLTLLEQNDEGRRRRNNIFIDLSQDYVTLLTILVTNGDLVQAQDIGKQFLSDLSTEVNDYTNLGSNLVLDSIDNLTNPSYILDTIVPDIAPIQQLVPLAVGMEIKEFIKEKFKGNI